MGKYVKSSVVASYSLQGKLENIYPSAKKASESLGVFSRSIDKAIRMETTIKGLQWKRYMSEKNVLSSISPYKKATLNNTKIRVAKLDDKGNTIKIYPSIYSASKENNISTKQIRECLLGHQNKAGSFYWKKLPA